jgi:hypothetical protein
MTPFDLGAPEQRLRFFLLPRSYLKTIVAATLTLEVMIERFRSLILLDLMWLAYKSANLASHLQDVL